MGYRSRALTLMLSPISALLATPASAAETITYTYDALGRLALVVHSGTVNNGVQSSYTFDATDNRTNMIVTGAFSRVVVVPINGLTVIPINDP